MDLLLLGYITFAVFLGWWTARLARSKGRRSYLWWGAAAFTFSLLPGLDVLPGPGSLIGFAPLFLLLFLRTAGQVTPAPPRERPCPRCQASHPASQRYCVSCGWELERAYPEMSAAETSTAETGGSEAPVAEADPSPPVETLPPQDADAAPVAAPAAEARPPAAAAPVMASEEAQPAQPAAEVSAPAPPEAAPEPPVFRGPPTAPNMTERGIRLFNQGRVQEAIDQFTKAIALDSNYKEAWERRAEAYSKLGRGEQAAEDLRRLQAINPG